MAFCELPRHLRLCAAEAVIAVCVFGAPLVYAAPSAPEMSLGAGAAADQDRIAAKRQEMNALLEEVRAKLKSLPILPPERKGESREVRRQRQQREELQALFKEIEARIDRDPLHTRYESAGSLKNPVADAYVDRLKKKIEVHGSQNFPTRAGKSVYGRVTLFMHLDPSGQIADLGVVESTSSFLASYAQKLVRDVAPFEAFPPEIAGSADILVMPLNFNFSND